MKIIVNGKNAAFKHGFSFDYTWENRLFLGRDGYTLSIAFPLKDCPQNIEIFGHIHRLDVDKKQLSFECAIIDSHVSLFGTLSVVKISDVEVECQFTDGRCEQVANDPFDETYINELDLGSYPVIEASQITPSDAWRGCDAGMNAVALPWINEASPTAPNNWVDIVGSSYSWATEVSSLSWQPYLLYIAKAICNAIGYQSDFSAWEESGYRYLIICNTLPAAWGKSGFAEALPHWTVSEFFEKLELLLKGEFEFDHRERTIEFSFSKDVLAGISPVYIDRLVDKYTTEISDADSRCDYIGAKRLAYKDCGHMMSNFYSCDWMVVGRNARKYSNLQTLIGANKHESFISVNGVKLPEFGEKTITPHGYNYTIYGLMYAEYEQTYFTMRSIGTFAYYAVGSPADWYAQLYVLQPVNVFGSGMVESEDVDTEEIEFCPVCISDTHVSNTDDRGYMMYLSFGATDEAEVSDGEHRPNDPAVRQISFVRAIIDGKKDDVYSAYYDVVYVAFWDGAKPMEGAQPYPFLDSVTVRQDWVQVSPHIPDLRLYNSPSCYAQQIPMIDKQKKFKFSWISDKIPNPRAVFHIRGKRFVCEKITATFSENGMSQLLKGEFYPMIDS